MLNQSENLHIHTCMSLHISGLDMINQSEHLDYAKHNQSEIFHWERTIRFLLLLQIYIYILAAMQLL
jgi:hypothetical protein